MSGTRNRSQIVQKTLASILLLTLLPAQTATAASYPITISYGRSWPLSVVVDSSRGLAYVDGMSGIYPPTGFTFGVINVTSHELVKVLPLDEIPGALALDQANGNVYIAGNDSFRVFDAGNQSMGRWIVVGHPVHSIAYDGSVSQDVFVSAGNGVFAISPQSGRIVGNATVGYGANGMAIDPATGKLFVAEYPDFEVFIFRTRDLSQLGVIKLPFCCADQMAIDSKTHLLFVTTDTKYVDVINAQSDALLNSVAVASTNQNSTNLVAVDTQTGRAFVSSSPGGSIVELDSSGNAVVGRFGVSSQVAGMAVDFKTHELFVANYHQVTVFDVGDAHILLFILPFAAAGVAVLVVVFFLASRRKPAKGEP